MNKLIKLMCVLLIISLLVIPRVACATPLTLTITAVNDMVVEVAEDGTFSADVELTEGENTITVVATLGEETLAKTVTVTYLLEEGGR